GVRVPGVSKDLNLIIPTPRGHRELEVEGNEAYVARVLGVSIETVMERVRVLTRRRIHGRTGVFIKEPVPPGASIEEVVDRLIREVPAFRRRVQGA
ncbi:MAG: DNA polymerase subunit beta, partial [Desulfurococcales archaeon]|nr:DNA polymerase subunit beta [Desulfurococcales archaeon]